MTAPKKPKPKKAKNPVKKQAGTGARVNGLLPKQAKFVAEYLISGNATQAAIHAGYSAKTAHKIGTENLHKPVIASLLSQKQAEIAARQDERLDAMELTVERVNRETARIAFFDARKMFAPDGRPLDITELDDDTAACIVGLDVLEEFDGSGKDRKMIGHIKKYKIADKNTSLERAAKILGMFGEDNKQKVNPLLSLIANLGSTAAPIVANDPDHLK